MPLLALIAVTAVWGVTFVQVKDAVDVYPLFAFLAIRYAIATGVLALVGGRRVLTLGRSGFAAGAVLGVLLGLGIGLQTAGLERTTVSSTGLHHRPLRRADAALRAAALPHARGARGLGRRRARGRRARDAERRARRLARRRTCSCSPPTAAQALQILMVERYASRYDAIALVLVEMGACFVGFLAIALALGQLEVPRGWTVWGALIVTGVFASALGYLIQVWAQRRISAARIAIVFSLETVFAGIFGYWLADDRLGWLGWGGCAVILVGIAVAEPTAARFLRSLLPSD